MNFQKEFQIEPVLAALIGFGFAFTQSKIECLIATDVELFAGKMRQEFVEEAFDQLEAGWIEGIEGESAGVPCSPGKCEAFGTNRQALVVWVFEPALHMAEGILIGDQFDESCAAIGVELENFFAGHWAGL